METALAIAIAVMVVLLVVVGPMLIVRKRRRSHLRERFGGEYDRTLDAMPAFTERTVTDAGELRRQVDEVRERGYAKAVDELEVGLTAVAAPIRNAHGDVVAALSVFTIAVILVVSLLLHRLAGGELETIV